VGVLSDERTGLNFIYVAGTRHRSLSWVPVPLDCLRFETSLFVASYDSQGHGGGIRLRLHTGYDGSIHEWIVFITQGEPNRSHDVVQFLCYSVSILCRGNMDSSRFQASCHDTNNEICVYIYRVTKKDWLNFVSLYIKHMTSDKYDVKYVWLYSQ
jgi:hypothetical protein